MHTRFADVVIEQFNSNLPAWIDVFCGPSIPASSNVRLGWRQKELAVKNDWYMYPGGWFEQPKLFRFPSDETCTVAAHKVAITKEEAKRLQVAFKAWKKRDKLRQERAKALRELEARELSNRLADWP